MNWEPYHDGIGAVSRTQPNRLVVFRNGDGLVHLQPGVQPGGTVDRDHALSQPRPESPRSITPSAASGWDATSVSSSARA